MNVRFLPVLGLLWGCTPQPVLVPDQGGNLALASQGGISLVADATAWGNQWGVEDTLTPIAIDIRNGSKRKVIVRAQDMSLVDETGRRYDVFPLGARPGNNQNPNQRVVPEEQKQTPPSDLPEEPAPTPPGKPKESPNKAKDDQKKPEQKPSNDEWVEIKADRPMYANADIVFADGDEQSDFEFAAGAAPSRPSAPPRMGGPAPSPRPSAPPRMGSGGGGYYRAPAPGGYYRAPQSRYYGPGPRVYVNPGWRYGYPYGYYGGWNGYYGYGYGYYGGSYGGFWDPYWGVFWGPRYGYGYYLYGPWNYARPADDVLSGMVRVALLDTTLEPTQSTRGFVFFQYALDQSRTLTLRWTPRDAETNEALPTLQTVFRVARGQ